MNLRSTLTFSGISPVSVGMKRISEETKSILICLNWDYYPTEMDMDSRYSRQTLLAEIGKEGQQKLLQAKVLVIGAGGLGCPVLQYLGAAGIGTIGIIDPDTVDISNLQRQTLYTTRDQGKLKASLAKERLSQLNPDISIHAYNEALTEKNAVDLFSVYDVIVDGTDNFSARFLINDAAIKTGKPVIYGAIQEFEGQISVFGAAGGPCYRCLHPHPPEAVIMNCAEAGIVGAVAGIIGTLQAMETIKLIVGHSSFAPLSGMLWMIDLRTMETRTIKIPKNKNCAVCSKSPADITLPSYSPVCSVALVEEIEWSDIARFKDALVIDVREQAEWEASHVAGAKHVPLSALQKNPAAFSPEKGRTCVLYCQRGMRSRKAAELLLDAGHRNIFSVRGGYAARPDQATR